MEKITLKGKEYDILFDVNVLGKIQKRYGDIDALGDKLTEIDETRWVLTEIINEALEYKAVILHEEIEKGEYMTEQKLGMMLSFNDLNSPEITKAIVDAFNEGMGGEKNLLAGE